jgi:hypothetical protein
MIYLDDAFFSLRMSQRLTSLIERITTTLEAFKDLYFVLTVVHSDPVA